MVFTPLSSASLVLAPNALAPGATYVFQLNASDSYGLGRAVLTVPVSRAPRGVDSLLGTASATPPAGFGLQTPFQLTASNWLDEDGPLSYQWSYRLPGAASAVPLSGFRTDYRSVTFFLPAADLLFASAIEVQLRVQNAFGVAAPAPVNATVFVSWAPGSYSVRAQTKAHRDNPDVSPSTALSQK